MMDDGVLILHDRSKFWENLNEDYLTLISCGEFGSACVSMSPDVSELDS